MNFDCMKIGFKGVLNMKKVIFNHFKIKIKTKHTLYKPRSDRKGNKNEERLISYG